MSWLETCRGAVPRWEVDNVDHFTVAYYFSRIEDATVALLDAIGLGREALAAEGRAWTVAECRVRYLKELRVGDIFHIRSGVIAAGDTGLALGHELIGSADGTLCTTVEQRALVVDAATRAPRPLGRAPQDEAEAYRVAWEHAPDTAARLTLPAGDEGFIDTGRDAVKPFEVDTLGLAAPPAYIHRFSAAGGHLLAALGMTPAYMRGEQRGFSTFEFRLDFPGALRAGDLARVRSALVHVGTSSMRILHRMANARTGAPVAILEQSGVHLDIAARRPAPLPDELRARARALLIGARVDGAAPA